MTTLIKREQLSSLLKHIELETDGRSSSSEGWVAYASLTESVVEGWLGSELTDAETSAQASHTAWINSVLNPPAPPTVNKALPW